MKVTIAVENVSPNLDNESFEKELIEFVQDAVDFWGGREKGNPDSLVTVVFEE